MEQNKLSNDEIFPMKNLIGFKFKDIKQIRTQLNSQARQRNPKMSTWFQVSGQQQQYTIMKCIVTPACKAFIKLFFSIGQGFIVDSALTKHNHSKNQQLQALKSHHIIAPFISKYTPSKAKDSIIEGKYRIRTNCCCKTNPGETAIAYSITNEKGQTIIERCQKFDDFTNNKAEFTAVMYSLLDCYQYGINNIEINNRSKLLVDFMNGLSKVSAPALKDIAQATKLLSSRLPGKIVYIIMNKQQSSLKLQNLCRKILGLLQTKDK